MSVAVASKRKRPIGALGKPASRPRKVRRAASYHSSSDEDDNDIVPADIAPSDDSIDDDDDDGAGVQLPNLLDASSGDQDEDNINDSKDNEHSDDDDSSDAGTNSDSDMASHSSMSEGQDRDDNDDDEDEDEDEDGGTAASGTRKPRKRNDPTQFATSISKILASKLTKDKRADPVLSRSKDASELSKELTEGRLEAKARRKMRDDKRAAMSKGREKDVLGLSREDASAGAVQEEERQLKKTAQRGVVKLFNAVRAAQVKGEVAAREVKGAGVVGTDKRQEKVNEMSKKGFLDLLVDGGT